MRRGDDGIVVPRHVSSSTRSMLVRSAQANERERYRSLASSIRLAKVFVCCPSMASNPGRPSIGPAENAASDNESDEVIVSIYQPGAAGHLVAAQRDRGGNPRRLNNLVTQKGPPMLVLLVASPTGRWYPELQAKTLESEGVWSALKNV